MKAAVLCGKESMRVEEVALRPLSPGEVRIKIEAALTCGTDLKVFKRGYHAGSQGWHGQFLRWLSGGDDHYARHNTDPLLEPDNAGEFPPYAEGGAAGAGFYRGRGGACRRLPGRGLYFERAAGVV